MQSETTPLISIITVCYQAEATIERTMRSVACQTALEWEHIIVDGASRDATLEIVRTYATARTRWISEPDKGLYNAMNKALKMARGRYVWFVNAGDTLRREDTIQTLVEALKQEATLPDVVYGDTMLVDNSGADLRLRDLRPPRHLRFDSFRKGMLVCHQAFMPLRELAPLYDERYRFSSDFDWCIKILQNSRHTLFVPEVWVNYLSEGLTTNNWKKSLLERYRIMVHHYGWCSTTLFHIAFVSRFLRNKIRRG